MEREYIAGRELAKKMVSENKAKAEKVRKVIEMARIAQKLDGINYENDYWLKEGFLDGTKELLDSSSRRLNH